MREPVLEVVVTSVEEAVAAVAGGANRLEVATDMAADGMTPDLADFRRVRDSVSVPLRVMLRDHGGFRAADPDRLREAASALRAAGADAFVLGFLTPGGTLDLPAVTSVLSAVPGCRWTFHRAMDHAADRAAVRRALRGLPGLDTVLTAGSVTGVADGLDVLLSESAVLDPDGPGTGTGTGTGVCVMAGGGLLPRHVPALRAHGVDAFHVGTSVRHGGWGTPVDPAAVSRWRRLVESAAVEPGVLEPPCPNPPERSPAPVSGEVTPQSDRCDFCEIVSGRLHAEILYEDESTVAFLDNTAVMEGHTLVIPRRHAADIWAVSEDEAADVMRTSHRMARILDGVFAPDGMTLFQANRPAGWQDVFHLHVHLVPRRDADHLHRPWSAERADPAALARTRRRVLGPQRADAPARGTNPSPAPVPGRPEEDRSRP